MNVTGTSSRRLELVRSTPFSKEADGGKTLEVAMAVTVFKKLQDAGYIGPKTKLADDVSKTATSKATSYEARLVELIRDTDGNGKLEIDLDALASSGLLKGSPTASDLQNTLEGRTAAGTVSDAFVAKQSSDSKLTGARADAVQAFSNGMVLKNETDAATLSSFYARASTDPKAVAKEAVAAAQVLTMKGKNADARELLQLAAGALQQAGQLTEARAVLMPLTQPPHASAPRQLLQDELDITRSRLKAGETFDPKRHVLPRETSGNKLEVAVDGEAVNTTVGAAAQLQLDQLALQERMQTTLGRKVDPSSLADASAYFQAFANGKDAAAVSQEYAGYLRTRYVHAGGGGGVEWNRKIPQDARAGRLEELLDGQLTDEVGRRVVDCEGFAYLTDRLLGGIKNADGTNRFSVEYASKQSHVITAVTEPATKRLFMVNNEKVTPVTVPAGERDRQTKIAREVCGNDDVNFVGINRLQSGSEPVGHGSQIEVPKPGSLIFKNGRIVGEVDALQAQRFLEYSRRTGNGFSQWIRDEW